MIAISSTQKIANDSHCVHGYPPMTGVPALRQAASDKVAMTTGHRYDPDTEITITAGATQGLLSAVLALVHPGDDVIVLEPCYDSYGPSIELAGGRTIRVPLTPGTWRPDFDALATALTPRTRLVIVNTPHNPSGTVWTSAELARFAPAQVTSGGRVMTARALETIAISADLKTRALPAFDAWITTHNKRP